MAYDELIARPRDAARAERPAPDAMVSYLEKVLLHAYKVTDRDVQELKEAGFSEDEIFEHTVSAAAAAGLGRLDAGARDAPMRLAVVDAGADARALRCVRLVAEPGSLLNERPRRGRVVRTR